MSIFTRIIGVGLKAIAGAFATAIVFGAISGGATLVAAYLIEHYEHWSTMELTYIIAGVIAVFAAYAAAATSFLRSIAREVTAATKVVATDVEKVVTGHK